MKSPLSNPAHWRLETLLSFDPEEVHELARRAAGTLTSYRLILGRCLLVLHENKAFKRYGCSSAIHYASSVLGLSPRVARACRRVARLLQDLPELTLAAELGQISWSKLREVVRKADPQTESFWLELTKTRTYKDIEALIRRTPKGALPGDVPAKGESLHSELRCHLSDEVFALLQTARRRFSLEKGEAVTNAEVLEWALTSYLAGQPIDDQALEMTRAEADKDLQAAQARELPLVQQARDLAEEMGLLSEVCESDVELEEVCPEDLMIQAAGSTALTDFDVSGKPARVIREALATEREEFVWLNPKLRYNPKNRHTTPAQKKEILRRDGWSCSVPGCSNQVWLHLHHLKPYSRGGGTERKNLLCLCAACHRNHHKGELRITSTQSGLLFTDQLGQRLDFQVELERAGWLDYWLGWTGEEGDSHTARVYGKDWEYERAG